MMNSIAPVWDGNETCLVFGGTLLIAAFPLAYATLLPAFYVPLLTMLFALIFRGVAFEFRFRATRFRRIWDWAFAVDFRRVSVRGSCSAGSSKGSQSRTAPSPAAHSIFSARSRSSAVSGWSPDTRCSARLG